jgi:putative ABC transport system permease protein
MPVFSPAAARVGFSTLRANPLRTLLSTLGVIMGVAALVSVLSLGDGMERYARAQVDRTSDLQFVTVQPITTRLIDGQVFARADVRRFTPQDADDLTRALTTPSQVGLVFSGAALVRRPGVAARGAQVVGITPRLAEARGTTLVAGRWYADADTMAGHVGVVVTDALARALLPGGALLDSSITLQQVPVRVVGIVAGADSADFHVMVPVRSAAALMAPSASPRVPMLAVHVDSVDRVSVARADVERWLTRTDPAWKSRVQVQTNTMRLDQLAQGLLLFKLFMGALTGISLLVGGIGIMNVLLASVVERTREIGIRRAAGATRREILQQFLAESVAISLAGAALGAAIGVAAAYGVTAFMRARVHAQLHAGLSVSTLVVAMLSSMVVGIGFGLYPALTAARLAPIDAIRHE